VLLLDVFRGDRLNVVFKGIIVLLLVVVGGCGIGKVRGGGRGVIMDGYTY